MTTGQFRELLAKAFRRWNSNGAPRMAAAFSYYAILSLAPLLLFAVAIASQFLYTGELRSTLLTEARRQLGTPAAALVGQMIDSAHKPGASALAAGVSIILALFGASGLFDQLKIASKQIWEIEEKSVNPIKQYVASKLLSIVMTLIFVTVILGWIGMDSAITYIRHHTDRHYPAWPFVSFLASVGFLTVIFAITFRSFPKGQATWHDVWLPAFITAVGFGIAKYLFSLYFGVGNVGGGYGPAGALVVILLWLYYSSQILFFGFELTYVFSHSYGSRRLGEGVVGSEDRLANL